MVQYILHGLHEVSMATVEVYEGEVGAICAQVEHTLLELGRVHTGLLKERLEQNNMTMWDSL